MGVVWHGVALALLIAATASSAAIVLSNAPLVVTQQPRDVGALWLMQIVDHASSQRYRFGVLGWCKNAANEPASICVTKLLWKLPKDDSGEAFLSNLPNTLSRSMSDIGICLIIVMILSFALLGTILIWATCKQPLYLWPGKPQFFGGLPKTVQRVGQSDKVAKPGYFKLSPQAQLACVLLDVTLFFSIPVWVYVRLAVNDVREMHPGQEVSYAYGFKTSIAVFLLSSIGVTLWLLGGLQRAHKGQNVLPKA